MEILPLSTWIVDCDPQSQTHQNLAEEGEMGSKEGVRGGGRGGDRDIEGGGEGGGQGVLCPGISSTSVLSCKELADRLD